MKTMVYGMNSKAIIIFLALNSMIKNKKIGIWGQRHLEYIKHHRKGFYTALVLDCKLNRYLADINKQAEEMFNTLILQYKNAEGITEQLKEDNQMEWIRLMNNIKNVVQELVYKEIIYN